MRSLVKTYFTEASSSEINIVTRGLSASLHEIQKLNQLLSNVLSNEYKEFFTDQLNSLVQSKKFFENIVQRSSLSFSAVRTNLPVRF